MRDFVDVFLVERFFFFFFTKIHPKIYPLFVTDIVQNGYSIWL